jgi:hypothetical protein
MVTDNSEFGVLTRLDTNVLLRIAMRCRQLWFSDDLFDTSRGTPLRGVFPALDKKQKNNDLK